MPQHSKDDSTFAMPLSESGVDLAGDSSAGALGTGPRQVLARRYELIGLVGVGGMGTVYRARDLELDEVVALKMLRREIGSAPGMLERFRREVRLSRKVTHPNVARVFDIGEFEGDKFLTMEFIEGESLAALLAREGRLGVPRALEILEGVCAGLAAAHRAGVIHRDLKPDNVLLARDGRVVLSDFGIARALDLEGEAGKTLGAIVGTPAYMAPEQVQGAKDIDDRADIYALGAMVYEMLTGERAWQGDGPFAVAAARLVSDPPDPRTRRRDLPDALARTVLRCMARSRDARFSSVELVSRELASLTLPAAPVPISVMPPKPPPSAVKVEPSEKNVAVLPFRNQGPASDVYLAEELTDDLIDTLSMTRGLRVRPRGVVARWKEGDHDPRAVGRELDVQVVVEGSVRRRDGSVRISARLISVADGYQLWAKRFDRNEAELLRINEEAAESIAQALTLELSAPNRLSPKDPVAVDLYMRGRHEYRKFWSEPIARAIELFEQALAREPGNPMILAACALARTRLWFFTNQGSELAEQAAAGAIAAAPDLADARLAMAAVHFQRFEVVRAVRELKRAVSAGAASAEAQGLLAYILLEIGAVDDGIRHAEAALALDPSPPLLLPALSRAYVLIGMLEKAESVTTQGIHSMDVGNRLAVRCRLAMWRRDVPELLALKEEIAASSALSSHLLFGRMLEDVVVQRRMPAALDSGAEASPVGTKRRQAFFQQLGAECAGFLGLIDTGLTAIERSIHFGLIDLLWLERCPMLDGMRADPRFGPLHAAVKRRAEEIFSAYLGVD